MSEGNIITFYSYKGGTGRSMTLANVAWILASNGKRVLVVDWDLEAPGLHRYFAPFLADKELTSTRGLIDLLVDFASQAITPVESERKPGWHEQAIDILDYIVRIDWKFSDPGKIDLLPAGQQGETYATRTNSFNWQSFYERFGGGAFLESLRKKMKATYDYVLIDSRTGVSDTAGICTVQFPDTLVVLYTGNNQSIEGTAAIAASVEEHWNRDATRSRRIFPVMTRLDNSERDKLDARRRLGRERFDRFLVERTPKEREVYRGAVAMPYVPWYSYEEVLSPFGDTPGDRASITAACEALTAELTTYTVQSLVWPSEEERTRFRKRPIEEGDQIESDLVFVTYDHPGVSVQQIMRFLETKFRVVTGVTVPQRCRAWVALILGDKDKNRVDAFLPSGGSNLANFIPVHLPGWRAPKAKPFLEIGDRTIHEHVPIDMTMAVSEAALYRLECAVRDILPNEKRLGELESRARRRLRQLVAVAVGVSVAAVGGGFGVMKLIGNNEVICSVPTSNYRQPNDNDHGWCQSSGHCVVSMPNGGKIEGTCESRSQVEAWVSSTATNVELWSGTYRGGKRDGSWNLPASFRGETLPSITKYQNGVRTSSTLHLPSGATVTLTPNLTLGEIDNVEISCLQNTTTLIAIGSTGMTSSQTQFSISDARSSFSGTLSGNPRAPLENATPIGQWKYSRFGGHSIVDLTQYPPLEHERAIWVPILASLLADASMVEQCKPVELAQPLCADGTLWSNAGCPRYVCSYRGGKFQPLGAYDATCTENNDTSLLRMAQEQHLTCNIIVTCKS